MKSQEHPYLDLQLSDSPASVNPKLNTHVTQNSSKVVLCTGLPLSVAFYPPIKMRGIPCNVPSVGRARRCRCLIKNQEKSFGRSLHAHISHIWRLQLRPQTPNTEPTRHNAYIAIAGHDIDRPDLLADHRSAQNASSESVLNTQKRFRHINTLNHTPMADKCTLTILTANALSATSSPSRVTKHIIS